MGPGIFGLGFGLVLGQHASLSPTAAISIAEHSRPSVISAREKVHGAEDMRRALGSYPATRLEFGDGTQPELQQGEDFLVAQPFDIFGKSDALRKTGDGPLLSAKAGLAQTELDVQAQVLSAYSTAAAAEKLVRTATDLDKVAEAVYSATKSRVDKGDLPPMELLRADLERERASARLEARQLDARAARTRLEAALGQTLDEGTILSLEEAPPAATPNVSNRPDIQLALADIASAAADAKVNSLENLPDMELQFRRAPWSLPERYDLRVQVVWPIFDHGAAELKARSARDMKRAAQRSLDDRRSQAASEVKATLQDLESARRSLSRLSKLLDDAQQLLVKEQRGYDLGASTLIEVLDASRALKEIEESQVEAQRRVFEAASAYLTASGTVVAPA